MSMSLWPAPKPLEGVKSKKQAIFNVASAEIIVGDKVCKAEGLSLTRTSRCAAVGEGGRAAVALLLGEVQAEMGEAARHEALEVVRLGPDLLSGQSDKADYLAAIDAALQQRPHVIVLEEARGTCEAWAQTFEEVLSSEAIRCFAGAVVVCVAEETSACGHLCTHCWVRVADCLREEPCLEVVENILSAREDDKEAQGLLDQVEFVDPFAHWVKRARDQSWMVTLLTKRRVDGSKELYGFICHHMFAPPKSEFHVRFLCVPECHRGRGYGKWLVRWVIERAAKMPEAECRWISLSSVDDKISFYENFGFTDMSTGPDENEQSWMELKNVSLVP